MGRGLRIERKRAMGVRARERRKGAEAMKSPNKVLFYGVDPPGYSSLSL